MRHKGSMDPPLVGGEGLFDNGCFCCEVMTWMEDVSWSGNIWGNNSFSIEFLKSCLQTKKFMLIFSQNITKWY
jgi:hypothetical protein